MRTLPLLLILAAAVTAPSTQAQQPSAEQPTTAPITAFTQDQAVAEIKKLGGTVQTDAKLPGNPIIRVGLGNTKVTDQGVKKLQEALPKCKIEH